MKKDTWKTIIQVVISVLTAALTALGTTSCMGHGKASPNGEVFFEIRGARCENSTKRLIHFSNL